MCVSVRSDTFGKSEKVRKIYLDHFPGLGRTECLLNS